MVQPALRAGLRLLELLGLRVHHLDLERNEPQVYDGKGATPNVWCSKNPKKARGASMTAGRLASARGTGAAGPSRPHCSHRACPRGSWRWSEGNARSAGVPDRTSDADSVKMLRRSAIPS